MNIGINGYEAVVPRFGFGKDGLPIRVGSAEFCYQLLVGLFDLDKSNSYTIYLPVKPTSDMPKERENWKYKIISAKKAWTLTSLSIELLRSRSLDVFFSPTHYLPIPAPSNSVVSILDVSYLHFPNLFKRKDLYQLKLWGGYSLKKARKILTISESSKSDIIKKYGISASKVVVVYPGVKSEIRSSKSQPANASHNALLAGETDSKFKMQNSKLTEKLGIEGKYILFVGTLQPRKNIVRLIEAFSRIDYSNLQLVIVGKKGWQYEEILEAPKKFGVEKNVLFLTEVEDEELPSLYQNAEFFILPSLYEGFGLPILEAMNYGTAVITSNVSSLPEAGGDAALYVDPNSAEDIVQKMRKLLEDDSLRKELIEKGYRQVKKFSWEKSAKQTLEVLEEVGKTN